MLKCKGGHLCQMIGTVINHEDYAKQNVVKKKKIIVFICNKFAQFQNARESYCFSHETFGFAMMFTRGGVSGDP